MNLAIRSIAATAASAVASAAETAYSSTKGRIIRGELHGAELLSELRIAEDLSLSRTPVHEAFLRLAADGLIEMSSRKGAVVVPMSPLEALDVLESREAIESAAAARLIANGGPDTEAHDELLRQLAVQAKALRTSDLPAFVEADDDFHSTVIRASHNEIAAHIWRMLRDRQQRLRYQLMRVQPEHLAISHAAHRELLRMLETRDADGYRTMLTQHVATHRGAL